MLPLPLCSLGLKGLPSRHQPDVYMSNGRCPEAERVYVLTKAMYPPLGYVPLRGLPQTKSVCIWFKMYSQLALHNADKTECRGRPLLISATRHVSGNPFVNGLQ